MNLRKDHYRSFLSLADKTTVNCIASVRGDRLVLNDLRIGPALSEFFKLLLFHSKLLLAFFLLAEACAKRDNF